MNQLYSSRKVEKACKENIKYMFLLEGVKDPDHSTIARFISLHFSFVAKTTMAKRLQKAADLVAECEVKYGFKIIYNHVVKLKHLKKLRKNSMQLKKKNLLYLFMVRGKEKVNSKNL